MEQTREEKFQALNQLVTQSNQQPQQQQQHSDRQLYSPTPKELAYALHILEHSFPSSLQLYNASLTSPSQQQPQNEISITGQDAVAFLTTSNIHRLILRILWTVVDPNNRGVLVELGQLHTILRLVALTQAGHVEPELLAVGTLPPGPKPTPVQVVWRILNQNRHTAVPLAQFDAVSIPPQEVLQQLYLTHQQQRVEGGQAPVPVAPRPQQSVSPVPNWQQQQQQAPVPVPAPVEPQGMAAFDLLAGAQDQPLPSLGAAPELTPPTDFGGFNNANNNNNMDTQSNNAPLPGLTTIPSPQGIAALDVFGAPVENAPLPSLGPDENAPLPSTFGGGGTMEPQIPAATAAAVNDFGGFTEASNFQGLTVNAPAANDQGDDDDFGGFTDAAPTPQDPATTNVGIPSPRGLAALDALGPMENAPLPSLGAVIGGPPLTDPTDEAQPSSGNTDMGGFSGTPTGPTATGMASAMDAFGSPTDAPLPALGGVLQAANDDQGDDDDFGGFSGTTTAPTATGMAAMDAFGSPTDAPLPALGGVQQAASDDQGNDDDFGGFENAAAPIATGMAAMDAFGSPTDAPLPVQGGVQQAANDDQGDDHWGGFSDAAPTGQPAMDAFGSPTDAPLRALGGVQQGTNNDQGDDDDFGGFENAAEPSLDVVGGATNAPLPALDQPLPSAGTMGVGALDALGPVENTPLSSFGEQPSQQPAAEAAATSDGGFGLFNDTLPQSQQHPQPSVGLGGMDAFDALTGAQDTPLPVLGMGQPQSERVLSTTMPPQPAIQTSASFPGMGFGDNSTTTDSGAFGMSAFDAMGPVQDAPLPSLGTNSTEASQATSADVGDFTDADQVMANESAEAPSTEDDSNMSFGSFTDGESGSKRRFNRSLRRSSRGSNRSIQSGTDDPVPKDLMPTLPGERYLETVRQSSLRQLPEDDPFAALDPAPVPVSVDLNEKLSLGPASECMPQDLMPHTPGEHYVPHASNATETPGGLATVGEPDDDFGDFEAAAPKRRASIPTPDPASEPDPFAANMTSEFTPHLTHPSPPPPSALSRQETPMPHDLMPHVPGEHYVPHSPNATETPGGLATVGEAFGEMAQVGNGMGGTDEFGDFFSDAGSGVPALPPPTQLSRQATPAAVDLQPVARKTNTIEAATIQEEEEEEDDEFGDFTAPETLGMPGQPAITTPTQMKRQETPRPQDLRPDFASSQNNRPDLPEGMGVISESLQEEVTDISQPTTEGDGQHTSFTPPQLSRQATPAAQDLDPLTKKGASGGAPGGMAIQETPQENDDDDSSSASPDLFSAFDSLAAPPAALPALPAFGSANETNQSDFAAPIDLSRQATPAVQDLQEITGKAPAPGTAAIAEGNEEDDDDDFGDFNAVPENSLTDLEGTGPSLGGPTSRVSESTTHSLDLFSGQQPTTLARQESGEKSTGKLGWKTTSSLISDDEEEEDDEVGAHRSVSDMFGSPNRGNSKSPTRVPAEIGVGPDASMEDESFGDFFESQSGEGSNQMPAPAQLSRQATPAGTDLQPVTRKLTVIDSATIHEEDDDDFGNFAEANADSVPVPEPSQLSRQATPATKDLEPLTHKASAGNIGNATIQEGDEDDEGEMDLFGGFEEAGTPGMMEIAPPTQMKRQATPMPKDLRPDLFAGSKTETQNLGAIGEDLGETFGDFPSSQVSPPPQLSRQATPAAQDLDPLTRKGASEGALVGMAIQEDEEDEDGFGAFAGDSDMVPVPPPAQLSRQATPAPQDLDPVTKKRASGGTLEGTPIQEGDEGEDDDDFDFGGFEEAGTPGELEVPPPPQMQRKETPRPQDLTSEKLSQSKIAQGPKLVSVGEEAESAFTQESPANDSFGDFAFAEEPASAPDNDEFGDDFGDFSSFPAAPAPSPFTDTSPADGASDWDAFQGAAGNEAAEASTGSNSPMREQIVTLSKKLPPPYRDSHDYGKLFDVIIGNQVSLSSDHQKRAERSIQVLSLLSSDHAKLASTYWGQALDVVHNELSLGLRLLQEASGLSGQELQLAKKPLETMVSGMGEYVRATRSIVASVGDMLLLDVATPLTGATIDSAWGSLPVTKRAFDVEKLWKSILENSSMQGLSHTTRLESLVEIRTKCLDRCPSTKLCQLSLQPLSGEDKQTTKATVDWDGKSFMACSANFLANKCPFYVVNK